METKLKESARAGRRWLRGAAAIAIRLAVRPPLIAVAAISLATLVAIAAFAETPSGVTLSGLFDPDLSELKPDAIGKLQEAAKKAYRDCYPPRVKFTVVVTAAEQSATGEHLAPARVYALQHALPSLGLEPDQFKVDSVTGVVDGVLVSYDKFNDDDKDPPKLLRITSIPPKDSKVKPGDKIKVTITASERYEDGHKSWPTGVYDIRLAALDGGSEATVDFKDYGRPTQPCERRTFEATFTVPRNPLPIVRLKAIAEDGVGHHQDSDVAKFYAGNRWQGTIRTDTIESHEGRNTRNASYESTLDLVVGYGDDIAGDGTAVLSSGCAPFPGQVVPTATKFTFKITGMAYKDRLELKFTYTGRTPQNGDNCGFGGAWFRGQALVVPILGSDIAEGTSDQPWTSGINVFKSSSATHLKCTNCK